MAASYELWLTDDYGRRLALIEEFSTFEASRIVNGIGSFKIEVPHNFDESLIALDNMLQVWRKPPGGEKSLWRAYFLRRWKWQTTGSSEKLILSGPDINDLLRRRIVAAYSESSPAKKTDYADDMLKEIVAESMSDAAAPTPDAGTRAWANLYVQGDTSQGPTLDKAFSFKTLLTMSGGGVLTSIAQAAKEAGTEVFFDIVPRNVESENVDFEFQTYVGQPGCDMTGRGILFSRAMGNLGDPSLEFDYAEEENYIYAGGRDVASNREIQQVYDTSRYLASQWNRCEGFADARSQPSANAVREAGRAVLERGRPKVRFSGRPIDTQRLVFGVDWNFGDRVKARYRQEFEAIIWSVVIHLNENGRETIQSRLEWESDG